VTILDENLVEGSQQDPNPLKLCAGDGSHGKPNKKRDISSKNQIEMR